MEQPPPTLLDRLKRRRVVQWTLAYLSAAWLVLQLVDVVGEQFGMPGALERAITVALAMGLLPAVVIAWYHGEKGHQRVTRTETLLLAALLFVGAGAVVGTLRGTAPAEVAADVVARPDGGIRIPVDRDAVAVLPFVPTARDSALGRLGRDLAVTLAATLDGIDGLRTVDGLTILAHTPADSPVLSLPRARGLAERLGAGRLLRGTLTRQPDGIRVDASLHGTDGARVARADVTLSGEGDLGALTDSLTLALVRRLWHGSTAELPSAAALRTRSAGALRAYVEGEEALARGEMVASVEAFERAFAHDSTYWFAYWRSLYPRIYEGSRADPRVIERVYRHRDELPPADRRLVEAGMTETVSDRLAVLDEATSLFPTHWPAWYSRADALIHSGSFVGTTYRDSRAALERVIALNPGFGSAWDHLFWVVVHQGDTAATRRVMARLREFVEPGSFEFDHDMEVYYGTTAEAVAGGDRLTPAALRRVSDYITGYTGPLPPAAFGTGLLTMGLPHSTLQVADEVLQRQPGAALTASMWRGKAYAWAGRGAWDSVAVATDRWVRADGAWSAHLGGYGLLATGAALGVIPAGDPARIRARLGEPSPDATADQRAELAWLDGITAFARDDDAALAAARRRLAGSGGRFVGYLDRSLEALQLRRRGHPDRALAVLAAAEDSAAEHGTPHDLRHVHPHVLTVDRVLLGRWLLDADRPADAVRTLTWNEAVLPGAPLLEVVSRTVGLLGTYERARAEEAMGRHDDALMHYRRFLEACDRPVGSLRPLVEDAARRAAELAPRVRG